MIDALLQFLLEEVAMDGDAGTSLDALAHFIADFYARNASSSSSGTGDDGRLQLVDDAFLSFVWDTLLAEPDVRVGVLTAITGAAEDDDGTPEAGPSAANAAEGGDGDEEDKPKKTPGKRRKIERKAQGPTHEMRILGDEERAEGCAALQARYGDELRVLAAEETAWVAITGSHTRLSSVTPMIYTVLQHVSRGRESGTTAVRISKELGIDPKSVFHYIKVPQQLGIVRKFSDVDDGCRTNRILHVRYLDRSEAWQMHVASEPDAVKDEDEGGADDAADGVAYGGEWTGAEMTPISPAYLGSNIPLIRARVVKAIKRRKDAWIPHIELHSSIGLHAMDHLATRRLNAIVTQLAAEGVLEKINVTRKKAGNKTAIAQALRLCAPPAADAEADELPAPPGGAAALAEDDDDGSYPVAGRPIERQVLDLLMDADARGLTIAEISAALGGFSPRFIDSMLQRLGRVPPPPHLADYAIHSMQETVGRLKQARWFSLVGYLAFRRARGFPDEKAEAAYAALREGARTGAFETPEGEPPAEGQYEGPRERQKRLEGFNVWAATGAGVAQGRKREAPAKKRVKAVGTPVAQGKAKAKDKDKGKGKAVDDGDGAAVQEDAEGEDASSPPPPPRAKTLGRPRKHPLKPGEESPYMRRKREKAENEERERMGLPPLERKKVPAPRKPKEGKKAKRGEEIARGEGVGGPDEMQVDEQPQAGPSSAAAQPTPGPSSAAAPPEGEETPAPKKKRGRPPKKAAAVAAATASEAPAPATPAGSEAEPSSTQLDTPAPAKRTRTAALASSSAAAAAPAATTPSKKRPRAADSTPAPGSEAKRPASRGPRMEAYLDIDLSPAKKRAKATQKALNALAGIASSSPPPVLQSEVPVEGSANGKGKEKAREEDEPQDAQEEDETLPDPATLQAGPSSSEAGPSTAQPDASPAPSATPSTPGPAATPALARVSATPMGTPSPLGGSPIVRKAAEVRSRKKPTALKKQARPSVVAQGNLTLLERQKDVVDYVTAHGGMVELPYGANVAIAQWLKQSRPDTRLMDRPVLLEAVEGCVKRELLRKTSAVGIKGERHNIYYLASIAPDSPQLAEFLRGLVAPVRAQRFSALPHVEGLVLDEAFDTADAEATEDKPASMLPDPVATDTPETVRQFFSQQPLIVGRSHGVRQGLAARARTMHTWLASWLFANVCNAELVARADAEGIVVAQRTLLDQMPVGIFVRLVPLPFESETLDAFLVVPANRDIAMSAAPADLLAIIRPQDRKRKAAMWKNFEALAFLRVLVPLIPHPSKKDDFELSRNPKQATHWRLPAAAPLYALGGDKSLINVCGLGSNDAVAEFWLELQEACRRPRKGMERAAIEDDRFPSACDWVGMYTIRKDLTMTDRWRDTYQLAQLQRSFLFLLVKHDPALVTDAENRAADIEKWAHALYAPVETVMAYLVSAHKRAQEDAAAAAAGRSVRRKRVKYEVAGGDDDAAPSEVNRKAAAAVALHRKIQGASQQRERDWDVFLERFRAEHNQPKLHAETVDWLHRAFLDPRRQVDAKHLDAELRRLLPAPAATATNENAAPVDPSFKTIVPISLQKKARLALDPYAVTKEPNIRKRVRKLRSKNTGQAGSGAPEQDEERDAAHAQIEGAQSGTQDEFLSVPIPPHPVLQPGKRLSRNHYSPEQDDLLLDAYAVLRARSEHLDMRIQFAAFEPFFSGSKSTSLRQRALAVLRRPGEQEYHDRLTAVYLEKYRAEGGDIPDPYPKSMVAFDLAACIRFLRAKVNKAQIRLMRSQPQVAHVQAIPLPSTLEQLKAQYSLVPTEHATTFSRRFDKVWAKFHVASNVREDSVLAVPLAETWVVKEAKADMGREKELTLGAIKAIFACDEHEYDSVEGAALLEPHCGELKELIDELEAKQILVSASSEKGRAVPGRNISYNDKFFHRFDNTTSMQRLREAAEFEKELHAEGEAVFPLVPTEGDMLAFFDLVSAGKVDLAIDTSVLSDKALDYDDFGTRQANDDDIECGVHMTPRAPLEKITVPLPEPLLPASITDDEAALETAKTSLPADADLARTIEFCVAAAGPAGSPLAFLASVAASTGGHLPHAIALLTRSETPLAFFGGTGALALVHARFLSSWALRTTAKRAFLPTLWTALDGRVNSEYWTRACAWVKGELCKRGGSTAPALIERAAQRQILAAHEVRSILATLYAVGKVARVEDRGGAGVGVEDVDWHGDHWFSLLPLPLFAQASSNRFEMMPTLPLEQLHILELAVPPLTREHLADHRELMRTWTLVCRDWCHEARRIVAVVPKLDYTKPEPEALRAAEAVLASATAGGRTLANLEVELDELSDDWPDDWLDTDRHGLPDVERIWVTAPNEGEIAVESFPRIRQLHLHDRLASDIVPSYALHHFPSSLTTMEVKAAYFEPWGPLPLRTLILDEAVYPMMIFKELSGLRFLAIRGALSDAIKNDLLHLLQRALEHLYFALSASPEGGMRAVAPNIAAHPFVLPPALKSLTFRYPSTFPVAVEVCGPLRAACEQQGVRFVEVVCTEADEEDWEAEEWVWALGG
ncbi:hypothetical protein JCM10450v2_007498 [Rhodotorula kratochvilovae]